MQSRAHTKDITSRVETFVENCINVKIHGNSDSTKGEVAVAAAPMWNKSESEFVFDDNCGEYRWCRVEYRHRLFINNTLTLTTTPFVIVCLMIIFFYICNVTACVVLLVQSSSKVVELELSIILLPLLAPF